MPPPVAPQPYRPSFSRPRRRGPASAWFLACLAGTALIGAGVALGLWFSPFVIGLAAGLVVRWGGWRPRVTVPAVLAMSVVGEGLALWIPALRDAPGDATARAIAAAAGLPASAGGSAGATLAVGASLGLAGLLLGRVAAPRPRHG